jgi:hypothetical protein
MEFIEFRNKLRRHVSEMLSGVGASSTRRNYVIAKITGAVSRSAKIIF